MNRHIILEGVDRVGKTSLLHAMAQRWQPVMTRKMAIPKNPLQSAQLYSDHFISLETATGPVFWDRGHLSELVYTKLYKPYWSHIWELSFRSLIHFVQPEIPVLIIYCYPISPELMLEDERPNANLNNELIQYELEVERFRMNKPANWHIYELATHVADSWRSDAHVTWRSYEEMMNEIENRWS